MVAAILLFLAGEPSGKAILSPYPFSRISMRFGVDLTDIGRIYIKGYLYPISYPKIAKKMTIFGYFCLKKCVFFVKYRNKL
jgi:hypothetical protein